MEDLPIELKTIEPIQLQKTLVLINNFTVNTVKFLNHFSVVCEGKLSETAIKINSLESSLSILEVKLNSIDGLQEVEAQIPTEVTPESLPTFDDAPPPAPPTATPEQTSSAAEQAPAPSVGPPIEETAVPPPPAEPVQEPEIPVITLKEHETTKKFFKMLKVGVNKEQVKMQMTVNGVDPNLIELDENDPVPPELLAASSAALPGVDNVD